MNLSDVIAHHAERFPERLALSYGDEEISYGRLLERIRRMAGVLREAGVHRGDVVAVLLHNAPRFVDVMCGCAHLGAIFMPLNWRLAGPELQYIVEHAGAKAMITEPELQPLTVGLEDLLRVPIDELWADATPITQAASVAGEDVMRLMYTSGTTSRPKGVMISYDNLYWKCAAHVVELEMTAADRGLACGPLYHVGALDITTTNMLYVGGSIHVLRKFDAAAALDAIEQRRLTNVWLAPAMVNLILAEPTLAERDCASMRLIADGGEKMPLPLIEKVLKAFPNAWFADAYGLTETVSGDTYLDKGRSVDKLGSVGKPVLHTDVSIQDLDDAPLPAGEVGEICLRGPKVFKGYWRDADATATAIRGGWFHTGDLGYLDDDGFLFIVDRLKDMIVSGGENIASLEVERVVYEHPAVLEAAVVASPHERWNEVPVAYVVVRSGETVTDDELAEFCAARLAKFKTPKGFRFLDALPRNPSGKVLKRVLREQEAASEPAAGGRGR
ncbi:MAG: fatty-acyl-CoA synthase [Solirubrobacteraceae bacterium]